MADDLKPADPTVASPTGQSIFPPAIFKWIALAFGVVLAALGGLVLIYPDEKRLAAAMIVLTAIAGVLGIASPGARKAVLMVALMFSVTLLPGCAWWQKTEPMLLDCAKGEVTSLLPTVIAEVVKILGSGTSDWQTDLESLAKAKGSELALCAVRAAVSNMESGGGGAGGLNAFEPPPGISPTVKLLRAYSFLETHPARAK